MKRSPLKRKTRLSPISKRRQAVLRAYKPLRDAFLKQHPTCSLCPQPSTDIHHLLPKGRGGEHNDPSNFLAVCRTCHNTIHNNPKWAEAHNLLRK
jgi:hypothetical protein